MTDTDDGDLVNEKDVIENLDEDLFCLLSTSLSLLLSVGNGGAEVLLDSSALFLKVKIRFKKPCFFSVGALRTSVFGGGAT